MPTGLKLPTNLRVAFGLAFLGMGVLLASRYIGLGENRDIIAEGRQSLAQSVAIHATRLLVDNPDALSEDLESLLQQNVELKSVAVYRRGSLAVATAGYAPMESASRKRCAVAPIELAEGSGRVELQFARETSKGVIGILRSRALRQLLFVVSLGTLAYSFYLKRVVHQLEPSQVIPDRVRAALDTFTEGLLVLDRNGRIVLANKSFTQAIDDSDDNLHSRPVSELPWRTVDGALPWIDTMADGNARTGRMVELCFGDSEITYMVNTSPILSPRGKLQGVLASFDDVTLHEERKHELEQTLRVLGESREQIRKQNEELLILATRDSLTGCMNRRSFFESAGNIANDNQVSAGHVAAIMVDIDHFKNVNDTHGHAVGDQALRVIGETLSDLEDETTIACRYGGEEFCIALAGRNAKEARAFAEGVRARIESSYPADIHITASLGVAVGTHANEEFHDILERADEALYVAKRRGRNQVVSDGEIGDVELLPVESGSFLESRLSPRSGIPFHGVTALISALTYRDATTAEHSRRVADLAVQLGSQLMSIREQYVLETAALLHDIGKVGTPDSILLKPGPLDADEKDVMGHHDMIGLEIVKTVFDNELLFDIVANHYAWFGGHPRLPDMPTGEDIPLGARIIAICDTYDAITQDRVYRKGASPEEAFGELRRCAGVQFDPELVELFIETQREGKRLDEPGSSENVTKRSALRIGLLMESLTRALESRDVPDVREQARQLAMAAADARVEEIAELADELRMMAEGDSEMEDMIGIATTLLDVCRMTQRAYLGVSPESRRQREEMARRIFSTEQEQVAD